MTNSSSIELSAVQAMLEAVATDLAAGLDIAPARLYTIESELNRALAVGIATTDQLLDFAPQFCDIAIIDDAAGAPAASIVLRLWQQRAPVVSTTSN